MCGHSDRNAASDSEQIYRRFSQGPISQAPKSAAQTAAQKSAADQVRPLSERELEDRGVRLAAVDMALRTCGAHPTPEFLLARARAIETFVNPPPAPPPWPKAPPSPPPAIPISDLATAMQIATNLETIGLNLTIELTAHGFRVEGRRGGLKLSKYAEFQGFASGLRNPLIPTIHDVVRALS